MAKALKAGDLHPVSLLVADEVRKDIIGVPDDLIDQAARETVGELVVALSNNQRKAVKNLTARAYKEGWTREELAERIASIVGLDPRRAAAVEAFRQGLVGREVGRGIARAQADEYASRLRWERANTIATHELANMVATAKRRAWEGAQRAGLIDQFAVRIWHTHRDEAMCKVCQPMNGQRAAVSRPYKRNGLIGPPAHPGCRCTETLERGGEVLAKVSGLDSSFKYRSLV